MDTLYCKKCGKLLSTRWTKKFCSISCSSSYNNKHRPKKIKKDKINICKECGINFTSKWKNMFCSKNCFSTYRKKNSVKTRTKTIINKCIVCDNITNYNRKFCDQCIADGWTQTWPNKPLLHRTLQEEMDINPYRGANTYNSIRANLRHKYLKTPEKMYCQHCGYTKHVECCHIKPIRDFPLDTPLNVINSDENVIILCSNCHWEFDHGLLKNNNDINWII